MNNTKQTLSLKNKIDIFVAKDNAGIGEGIHNMHPVIKDTFKRDIHPDYTKLPIIDEAANHTRRTTYKGQLDNINPYVLGLQSYNPQLDTQPRSPTHYFEYKDPNVDITVVDFLLPFGELYRMGLEDEAAYVQKAQERERLEQFKEDVKRLNLKTGDTLQFKADNTDDSNWIEVQVAYVTRSKNAVALINLNDTKNNDMFSELNGSDHIFIAGYQGIIGVFTYIEVEPTPYRLYNNLGFTHNTL